MKIVAALPWYDEQPSWLDRCVRSLKWVVDELVAVDGRWELYDEDAPILSHWEQGVAINKAAYAVGLDCSVHVPGRVWPSQVAKRAATMALCADSGADWVLVIDADEYVAKMEHGWRAKLLDTELDVALVGCHALYEQMPDRRLRRFFRAGTTVETAHNGYRYQGRWLHGDSAKVHLADALDLSDHLLLHDDSGRRQPERELKAMDYRRARARQRVEVWP